MYFSDPEFKVGQRFSRGAIYISVITISDFHTVGFSWILIMSGHCKNNLAFTHWFIYLFVHRKATGGTPVFYLLTFSSPVAIYCNVHSIETAIRCVRIDIICSRDNGKVPALAILDLSAVFNTIDHTVLLHHLAHRFGVSGLALNWFLSHVTPCTKPVFIEGPLSVQVPLVESIPRGSFLVPTFSVCITPLSTVWIQDGLIHC